MIINIEVSPLRSRRYRVYLLDGSFIDIGNSKQLNDFIDTGDKYARMDYYNSFTKDERKSFLKMKESRIVFEACILNGPTTNIITNINCLNEMLAD